MRTKSPSHARSQRGRLLGGLRSARKACADLTDAAPAGGVVITRAQASSADGFVRVWPAGASDEDAVKDEIAESEFDGIRKGVLRALIRHGWVVGRRRGRTARIVVRFHARVSSSSTVRAGSSRSVTLSLQLFDRMSAESRQLANRPTDHITSTPGTTYSA